MVNYDVYYLIEFKIKDIGVLSKIEHEILNDDYLKKLYYKFPKKLTVSSDIKKADNSSNTLVIKVSNNKYHFKNKDYFNLKELLNDYLVVPKLFENKMNIDNYKDKLSKLCYQKDIDKTKIISKYDKIINTNFNVMDGINSIYEWYTGAVYFKDYEWSQIKNNKIKDIFMIKKNNSYLFSLPLDDGIILRGSDIYYYYSSDVSRFKKPTIKQIRKWHKNCLNFLKIIKKELANYKIESNYDLRLLLAVIDNLRNIILLLCNTELLLMNKGNNFIINFEENYEESINEYRLLINDYIKLINNICFQRPVDSNIVKKIIFVIDKLLILSPNTIKKVSKEKDEYLRSKCFNPLREIDNYLENYIACEYSTSKIKSKEFNLIGVLYGGLELPFIIKNQELKKVNIYLLYQNHGMYLDRQVKNKNIVNDDLTEIKIIDKKKETYIIDDNMMSGITIQFVYNQLILKKYTNINGVIIIRHPNINRLPQLIHFDTAVNLNEIDNMIIGMLMDTPYTKIKFKTNYNNMFVNELNIFSIMTEIFLKALYKNNSFIKDSQVDIFLGYSKGKK